MVPGTVAEYRVLVYKGLEIYLEIEACLTKVNQGNSSTTVIVT